MKKILIGVLFLFFMVDANSQGILPLNYDFKLGLTAHPTFGMINAAKGNSNGTSLGFSYGLMADFNFSEHYSFSTALTVTTINGKSTEINVMPYHAVVSSTAPIAYDLKYKMQYIEIPLLIKLKTSKIKEIEWFGQFGLSNDFNIKARQDAKKANGLLADNVNSSDWTRFYRAGLVVGGGGSFDLDEHTSLVGGISFNNGITNITKSKNTVRNHFVSLDLGVFF